MARLTSSAVAKGANFGHQGYGNIGVRATSAFINAASTGGKLNTGAARSTTNPFPFQGHRCRSPSRYHGGYFLAQWGSNSGKPRRYRPFLPKRHRTKIESRSRRPSCVRPICPARGIKPVLTRFGPDGHLYYLMTTLCDREWSGASDPVGRWRRRRRRRPLHANGRSVLHSAVDVADRDSRGRRGHDCSLHASTAPRLTRAATAYSEADHASRRVAEY